MSFSWIAAKLKWETIIKVIIKINHHAIRIWNVSDIFASLNVKHNFYYNIYITIHLQATTRCIFKKQKYLDMFSHSNKSIHKSFINFNEEYKIN